MFKNKRFFILGMGRSGISSAKVLSKNNHVVLTDIKCDNLELIKELESQNINVVITDTPEEIFNDSYDYLVKNPGIKLDHKVVKMAEKFNMDIITELEVGYHYLPKGVKTIGITGSNGKTTTSVLTYEILKEAEKNVHLAGNGGTALCSVLDNIKENDNLVLEISSHQLVNLKDLKCDIAVLTNLSEVHLDHFGTYEKYKKNKLNIFNNMKKNDIAIINSTDKEVLKITKDIKPKKIFLNSSEDADICIKNNHIVYKNENIVAIDDIRIKGVHNYENIMCAVGAAKQFNVENKYIKEVLDKFTGVAHRNEFVKRINNIEFYNDSKATNVKSTITALKSFDNPTILLIGGLDRGHSFCDLVPYLKNVKFAFTFGETKNRVKEFMEKNNINVTVTDNLEEATKGAYNVAEKGDTILLSPACASWDQYKSFEDRGDEFKKIVESL